MPTFREDLHLGHKVAMVETDDLTNKSVTGGKIANRVIDWFHILAKAIRNEHIDDEAVDNRTLAEQSVTDSKLHKDAVTNEKIANDAVQTRNIKDRNVTGPKIALQCVLPEHFHQGTFWTLVRQYVEELQNQIDSLQVSGLALSNVFGGDPHIGISQKKLSWFANYVLTLLEEALGRTLLGFTWTVTPTYIYGEWPTTVHISAQPVTEGDFFEHIRLYQGDQLIDEVIDPTDSYSFDISLQQTVNLRMEAQLLGVAYQRTQKVNHYDSFWLGGGAAYSDIMDEAHNINFSEGTRLAKDVTVADGEHIIIMMGDAWVPAFIRADMNGVEIEFDETTVTIDGNNYKVLTSKSVFEAGTYNIDING